MASAADKLNAIRAEYKKVHGEPSTAGLVEVFRADEAEAGQWIDRYKRTAGRPYPAWCEVLGVLLLLGWRKVARNELANAAAAQDLEQERYVERVLARARR